MISERISDDIPPQMKMLNMDIPILMHLLLLSHLKLERCKPHKAARHPTKCDVINDVKLFPTVYRRIDCRKLLTLSNQTSRYKSKCIRMNVDRGLKLHDLILYFLLLSRTIIGSKTIFRSLWKIWVLCDFLNLSCRRMIATSRQS